MSYGVVVAAAAALDLRDRSRRWSSLSYCVLDAVWSIASRYDEVVVPLVRRVAEANGDHRPTFDADAPLPADPLPLPVLLDRYPTTESLRAITNGQLTSTKSGIPKAEAVLRYARILVDHGVTDLASVTSLMADPDRWDTVDRALAQVPGDGVRRDYLWMLSGSDDLVKPDRQILRWLARHGYETTVKEARTLLVRVARELTVRLHRPITPWMLDHAIWQAERLGTPCAQIRPAIIFDVEGLPPLKGEALSMFSVKHPQHERVKRLLTAAVDAKERTGWKSVGEPVELDVTVRSPGPLPEGDATNFLGGIADVLHGRKLSYGMDLSHFGDLAQCSIFDDDSQIREIAYRFVPDEESLYTVQVTMRQERGASTA